ncbi:hypothetical protein FB451DRAFT_502636 [Mycena latifolia]|nr:hypothetical protein FB451DRAFT_502636 [Mycena latifolia]
MGQLVLRSISPDSIPHWLVRRLGQGLELLLDHEHPQARVSSGRSRSAVSSACLRLLRTALVEVSNFNSLNQSSLVDNGEHSKSMSAVGPLVLILLVALAGVARCQSCSKVGVPNTDVQACSLQFLLSLGCYNLFNRLDHVRRRSFLAPEDIVLQLAKNGSQASLHAEAPELASPRTCTSTAHNHRSADC